MREKTGVRRWSEAEKRLLAAIYPDRDNAYISEMLHRSRPSVQNMAVKMGLRKSHAVYEAQHRKGQFKKGHVPFNRGKRWSQYLSEESQRSIRRTCFRKGVLNRHSPTLRPAGYECVRHDKSGRDYVWVKPSDGRRMMPKHQWVWERHNGPVPKGWNVQFRDGDTLNCDISNLYVIRRAEQLRENRGRMTAEQRQEMCKKAHEKRNRSIRRDKRRLLWGMQPVGKLVKRI